MQARTTLDEHLCHAKGATLNRPVERSHLAVILVGLQFGIGAAVEEEVDKLHVVTRDCPEQREFAFDVLQVWVGAGF